MNDFGSYLRELRGDKSLREMERITGISHTYLSTLEKGYDPRSGKERKPTPEVLRQLSDTIPNVDYIKLMKIAGYFSEEEINVEMDQIIRDIQLRTQTLSKIREALENAQNNNDKVLIKKYEKSLKLFEKNLSKLQHKYNLYIQHSNETSIENLNQFEQEEREYSSYQDFLSGKSTPIYLDENFEGNFYFFNSQGRLPEELQEKLRSIIKLTLS